MTPTPITFPFDGLDANRRGELSDAQRRGLGALARSNHRNSLNSALLLVAGAAIVWFLARPGASPLLHLLVPAIALTIAAVLVVRVGGGTDALSRDVRAGRVECVEGAIGKRRVGTGRARNLYYLDVGDRSFQVGERTYEAAPDMGRVRLYYLPASRKLVNLEPAADAPMPADLSPTGLLHTLGASLRSPTRRERNEARASFATLGNAIEAAFTPAAVTPPAARDPRPLAETLLGSWGNGFLTVTFSPDGTVTTRMLQGEMHGRWSVEGGRLHADIAGRQQSADAWVTGDQLTIALEGEGLTLTRQ